MWKTKNQLWRKKAPILRPRLTHQHRGQPLTPTVRPTALYWHNYNESFQLNDMDTFTSRGQRLWLESTTRPVPRVSLTSHKHIRAYFPQLSKVRAMDCRPHRGQDLNETLKKGLKRYWKKKRRGEIFWEFCDGKAMRRYRVPQLSGVRKEPDTTTVHSRVANGRTVWSCDAAWQHCWKSSKPNGEMTGTSWQRYRYKLQAS